MDMYLNQCTFLSGWDNGELNGFSQLVGTYTRGVMNGLIVFIDGAFWNQIAFTEWMIDQFDVALMETVS